MPAVQYDRIRSTKRLARRTSRSIAIIRYEQAGMVGQSLAQLRRVSTLLMRQFLNADKVPSAVALPGSIPPWKAQCELARTMIQVIEQRRILLRLPGPGRDQAGKMGGSAESRMIDVTEPPADPVDAEILRELEERAKERAAKTPQPVDNGGAGGEPKAP